jgi:hypothetical protein
MQSMSDVTQVFRADGEQWFNTMARMQDQFDKLVQQSSDLTKMSKDAVKELKQAGDKMGENADDLAESNDSIKDMVLGIGKMALSYASFDTLVQAANEKLAKQVELAEQVREKLTGQGSFDEEMLGNMGIFKQDEIDAAMRRVEAIAIQAGAASTGDIKRTVSEVSSILGQERNADTWIATEIGHKIAPATPAAATQLAKGAGAAAMIDPSISVEEGYAAMLSARDFSSIASLGDIAKGMPRAIGSVRDFSGAMSDEEMLKTSVALFATAAKRTSDMTGESTLTYMTQIQSQMGEFFGGKEGAPTTTHGRYLALLKDDKLREQFLSEAKVEARFKGFTRDWLTEGSEGSKGYLEAFEGTKLDRSLIDREIARADGATPAMKAAKRLRQEELEKEMMLTTDEVGEIYARSVEAMKMADTVSGRSFGRGYMARGADNAGILWDASFYREDAISARHEAVDMMVSDAKNMQKTRPEIWTKQHDRDLALLERQAIALENMEKEIKAMTEEQKTTNSHVQSNAAQADAARLQ